MSAGFAGFKTTCRVAVFFLLGGVLALQGTPALGDSAEAILARLAEDGDIAAAEAAAERTFAQTALYAEARDTAAFADAAHAFWLTHWIAQAKPANAAALTKRLLARPAAARELAYLIDSSDDIPAVFALFVKLDDRFGEKINDFPGLTAALCVVHDRTIQRNINENDVVATDPVELFAFYTAHEKQMLFGLREVPGPLLVWVVDSTASIDEMEWALREYAGDRQVGRRFFEIDYDYDHALKGTPKKVTQKGFSLPNIKRYGGVCADQAYFAVEVGKAIGVPAAYTVGRGGDVGHAWVGYFQQRGRTGAWNFNEGRYKSYQGVRGITEHPQTGRWVDDSYVSVLAEGITLPPQKRYAAAGMVTAAAVLGQLGDVEVTDVAHTFAAGRPQGARQHQSESEGEDDGAGTPPDEAVKLPQPVRGTSVKDRLALLTAALKVDPGDARGWYLVAGMAERGELSLAQKKTWAQYVTKLCGDRYPDFAVAVLRPIIASIDDTAQQSKLWDNALARFRRRSDLAAEIRMTQGALWEEARDYRKAAACYEDVIRRYGNAGPFIVPALERFEALLNTAGRGERVTVLYREAFKSLDLPDRFAPQFAQQSNYYRVGQRYLAKLQDAGDTAAATKLRDEIAKNTGLKP